MIDNKLVMRKLILIAGVFATLSCSGVEKVEGVNDDKTGDFSHSLKISSRLISRGRTALLNPAS